MEGETWKTPKRDGCWSHVEGAGGEGSSTNGEGRAVYALVFTTEPGASVSAAAHAGVSCHCRMAMRSSHRKGTLERYRCSCPPTDHLDFVDRKTSVVRRYDNDGAFQGFQRSLSPVVRAETAYFSQADLATKGSIYNPLTSSELP